MWELDAVSYRIVCEDGFFESADRMRTLLNDLAAVSKFFIVSDETVAVLSYAEKVFDVLKDSMIPVHLITIPPGEASKCREMKDFIEDELIRLHCDRSSLLVALGGGVVGDLVGFVAATFNRGIRYIQIPTTLLSMVDSSVGGKTAIDHPSGKNLIGAFHQPSLVIIDPRFLHTLPKRHISNGYAEIVKISITGNLDLFKDLERGTTDLANCIYQAIKYKLEIVSLDERDRGIRNVLNFGHTVGHAIEAQILLHGECVAIGMVYEMRALISMGLCTEQEISRLESVLHALNLPTLIPDSVDTDELMEYISRDKKGDCVTVNVETIGKVRSGPTVQVPRQLMKRIIAKSVTVWKSGEISGLVTLPGSKSISNRALILACYAAPCVVGNLNFCEDIRVMLDSLSTLGFDLKFPGPGQVSVEGFRAPKGKSLTLNVANAGTAARFLIPFVGRLLGTGCLEEISSIVIDGNDRMRTRPISDLIDCLRSCTVGNVEFNYLLNPGSLPLEISSVSPRENFFSDRVVISGKVSSQFVSAALLTAAADAGNRNLEICVSSADKNGVSTSQPYIDMTVAILENFGVRINHCGGTFTIPRKVTISRSEPFMVAPDASSASYPLAMAAISGGTVTVNIGPGNSCNQGDMGFIDILRDMGCRVAQTEISTTVSGPVKLCGVGSVDMGSCTDTFLTAASLMAIFGASEIRGIANQRVKECDRIAAVAGNLEICGYSVEETEDGLKFPGLGRNEFAQGEIRCFNDHRVAMSLAVLSVGNRNLEISIPEPRCVEKTFPGFWDCLERDLGCTVEAAPSRKLEPGNLWYLVGMRGSGKSTTAQIAASRLGWKFLDLDLKISSYLNMSISDFVAAHGWQAFREIECKILKEISRQSEPTIIACGGGIVEFRSSFNYLKRSQVIWLRLQNDEETIFRAAGGDRPALPGNLSDTWKRRKSLFQEISRFLLSPPEGSSLDETATLLFRILSPRQNHLPRNFLCLTLPSYATWKFLVDPETDALEVRLDLLENLDDLEVEISRLRLSTELPLILTLRSSNEGGSFHGSDSEYLEICSRALATRPDWLDVEISRSTPEFAKMLEQYAPFTRYICSKHILDFLPRNFQVRQFLSTVLSPNWAAVGKLVFKAASGEEISRFLELRREAEKLHGKKCVCILTGPKGKISRLFNFQMNPVTHKSLPAAAPGQLTIEEISRLRDTLGIIEPREFFLFGKPVKLSPSPVIHNSVFKSKFLPHTYTACETDDMEIVGRNFQAPSFGGCSVTIPLKQKVCGILDELCPLAAQVGAVNTVVRDTISRSLKGYNTDLLALQRGLQNVSGNCIVIGTGGAARAACAAAKSRGLDLFVYGRDALKAEEISRFFGGKVVTGNEGPFSVVIGCIPGFNDLKFPGDWFGPDTLVMEMAYTPRETRLLEISRRSGVTRVIDGLTLLVWQAVEQSKLFLSERKIDEEAISEVVRCHYRM